MDNKIITAEMREALKAPLPQEAITQHPTKTFLSSIKPIYVVERLNDVFGVGSWKIKSEIIDNKTSMIVVRATLTIPDYGIELESFGGNDNGGEDKKGFDLGDAYKGATTDALTKICSFLEIGIDVFKGKVKPQARQQYQSRPALEIGIDIFKGKVKPQARQQYQSRPATAQPATPSAPSTLDATNKQMLQNTITKCPACGGPISEAEKSFSTQKFGRPLCRNCQK